MALVLITHDLGLVAEYADRVAVMYSGRIVEEAPVAELFAQPRHPYTRGLLGSAPPLDDELDELIAIEGQPPAPGFWPSGCRFRPRCPAALPACADWQVELLTQSASHRSACWRSADLAAPLMNAGMPVTLAAPSADARPAQTFPSERGENAL